MFLKALSKSHCQLEGSSTRKLNLLPRQLQQLPLVAHHFPSSVSPTVAQYPHFLWQKGGNPGQQASLGREGGALQTSLTVADTTPLVVFPPPPQLFLVVPHSWRSLQKLLEVQKSKSCY